jgi:hypothetical protein
MLRLSALDTLQGVAGTASAVTYTVFGTETINSLSKPKKLAQGQLASSAGVMYTVPDSNSCQVDSIVLANTTGTLVSGLILYVAGTAAANQITGSLSIPANGTARLTDEGIQVTDGSGNTYTTASTVTLNGVASIAAASSAVANTETQIVGGTLAANSVAAGTTFLITAAGVGTTSSSPGSGTFRVRLGPTTLTGNIGTSVAAAFTASITAQPFTLQATVTIRTAGQAGTVIGEMNVLGSNVTTGLTAALNNLSTTTAAVAIDTTVANVLELTFISGAGTASCTFHVAQIAVVKQ